MRAGRFYRRKFCAFHWTL